MALTSRTYVNPVGAKPIVMGDPFAWQHAGNYYLTGTTDPEAGFRGYRSANLVDWTETGWLWRRQPDSWVDGRLWAPEVCAWRGKFYLTYSGTLRGVAPMRMLMGLAVSDHPEGPYRDLRTPWFDPGYSTIDGHLFIDDDDTPYLYFSRNGSRDGYDYGILYGVRLSEDLLTPVGEPIRLMEADQPWETEIRDWNRCNEGAAVIRVGSHYAMTYSANHYMHASYGIGAATAPHPLGPWTKDPANPIVSSDPAVGASGPGHNSIVWSPDRSERFMVYHAHADPTQPSDRRVVYIDRLDSDPDTGRLSLRGPTRSPQAWPRGVGGEVSAG
ncbi:glycoside hydrolase family 43 protein [Synoicihabitans lomoniglobus]|uniref:Glycoside hydrolase family 43 protein n=1 Tax=Synoicihabitans lomoniglobus TaxID=2909285 RepID=A0AAE9ZUM8_9BACT|nr:glycoside hydrolase family 43 protein [Opitutaceae bacterium LMO-M01]WED63626.1 glycoside hydrolase family 43 protein [Opitutaceae bacterium LMO-M01]